MARKAERWIPNELPVLGAIYSRFSDLSLRELSIITSAILDSALAELLTLRLVDASKETEEFLGLNGDGRAPVASFGARIQLALLLGIIKKMDAEMLRAMKQLRNLFAHHSKIEFNSPEAQKSTKRLYELWAKCKGIIDKSSLRELSPVEWKQLARDLPLHEYATSGLLLSVFAAYHLKFQRLNAEITRVSPIGSN
jgi:hypothetical protein